MSKKEDLTGKRKYDRREAARLMASGSALALGAGFFSRRAGGASLPNLVFILSDDHRWDHLSMLGHPFIETPRLDKLASEGVLFKNAFVTTSLCSPSRASFLTGNYAHTHGVKNNITAWSNHNITFLETLKEAGYHTAFIGKWHMPGELPHLRGADRFITFTVQGGQGRYFNCPLIVDGKPEPSRKPYITEELTDRALEFMSEHRDGPFCLFLSHKAAHHQFLPPPDVAGRYDDVKLDLPPEADPWVTVTNGHMFYGTLMPLSVHYRNYCETLYALDRQIGRVVDWIDEKGLTQDTLIAYAGDNGFFWGEHGLVDKRWAYEESIRIPFIVRYPRLAGTPSQREEMVLNVDLAPTLLDVAGAAPKTQMEGTSFKPLLTGPAKWRDAWLYEYFRDYPYAVPGIYAARTGNHVYIEYDNQRKPELYDIVKDPGQKNNLFGTRGNEHLLREMKMKLKSLKKRPA